MGLPNHPRIQPSIAWSCQVGLMGSPMFASVFSSQNLNHVENFKCGWGEREGTNSEFRPLPRSLEILPVCIVKDLDWSSWQRGSVYAISRIIPACEHLGECLVGRRESCQGGPVEEPAISLSISGTSERKDIRATSYHWRSSKIEGGVPGGGTAAAAAAFASLRFLICSCRSQRRRAVKHMMDCIGWFR